MTHNSLRPNTLTRILKYIKTDAYIYYDVMNHRALVLVSNIFKDLRDSATVEE